MVSWSVADWVWEVLVVVSLQEAEVGLLPEIEYAAGVSLQEAEVVCYPRQT
jgi:hypothetical protein